MQHVALPLIAILTAASGGGVALAQPGPSDPPRSESVRTDTSARAASARAGPVHAAPTRERAKPSNPANAGRAVLVPVLANTRDTSSVSMSFLGQPIDLRAPLQFDRVFALRSQPPTDMRGGILLNFGGGNVATSSAPLDVGDAAWFARVDGAIIALFPRSTYSQSKDGTVVDIPAGTIFAIGHPPAGMFGLEAGTPERSATSSDRQDSSRPTAMQARASASRSRPAVLAPARSGFDEPLGDAPASLADQQHANASPGPHVMHDEEYRARRIRGLLLKAAASTTARRADAKGRQAPD